MPNSDRLEFFWISLRYLLKDLNKNILFSISEAYIYCFCQRRRVKIMRIYTKELEFIKVIGSKNKN